MKRTYNRPQLTVHGNVEALTKATKSGSKIDQDLAAGTPLLEVVQSLS